MSSRNIKALIFAVFVLNTLPVFAQEKKLKKPGVSSKKKEEARVVNLKAVRSSDGVTFISWKVVPFKHRWKFSFKVLTPKKESGPSKIGCSYCEKIFSCDYGCIISGNEFITQSKTPDRLVLTNSVTSTQKFRAEIAIVNSSSTSQQISKVWRARYLESFKKVQKEKDAREALMSETATHWIQLFKKHIKGTSLKSLMECSWIIDALWDHLRAYRVRKNMKLSTSNSGRLIFPRDLQRGYSYAFPKSPKRDLSYQLQLKVDLLETQVKILEVKQLMNERIFEKILKELKRLRAREKEENKIK